MPIEGPLRELSIHDVFQLLDLAQKTGVLRVTSELRQNGGTVYFDQGAVVAAEIQSNPHLLGSLLVRAGKASEGDLARARDMQDAGDTRRLGEILVVIGAITRKELDRQVRAQVEEVIFELMGWSEGYFSFTEAPLDQVPAQATVRIPTGALMMESARRIDEWSRIESKIPHLGVIPRLVLHDGAEAGPIDLRPGEWEVLAAVDGTRDVRILADAVGKSEFDVARTLYGLATTGVVTLDDPRAPPLPAAVGGEIAELLARADAYLMAGNAEGALGAAREAAAAGGPSHIPSRVMAGRALLMSGAADQAATLFEHVLRADAVHAPARRLLGLAFAGQGRFEEAVEAWDTWSRLDDRPAEEDALGAWVSRLRAAAALLGRAARASYD